MSFLPPFSPIPARQQLLTPPTTSVILGSFSNYLVTKSSVPVMVARKRLRKQSKYKRPINQQVNNISNPTARSLANAKID